MTFDEAFDLLLGHEGGFVDHPEDPGGATRYGITQRTARLNGYLGDMQALPLAKAKEIARRQYWDAVSADLMPAAVRFPLFDMAYNSGAGQAVKLLQRAVHVDEDGKVGPHTLMAVNTYNPTATAARLNGHRLLFLADLATWQTFGKGWVRRVGKNLTSTKG